MGIFKKKNCDIQILEELKNKLIACLVCNDSNDYLKVCDDKGNIYEFKNQSYSTQTLEQISEIRRQGCSNIFAKRIKVYDGLVIEEAKDRNEVGLYTYKNGSEKLVVYKVSKRFLGYIKEQDFIEQMIFSYLKGEEIININKIIPVSKAIEAKNNSTSIKEVMPDSTLISLASGKKIRIIGDTLSRIFKDTINGLEMFNSFSREGRTK